jgi:hypothetical protein
MSAQSLPFQCDPARTRARKRVPSSPWLLIDLAVNGAVTIYFDPDTMEKAGRAWRVWTLQDYLRARDEGVRSEKLQIEFDGASGRTRGLRVIQFAGHMGEGRVINDVEDTTPWRRPRPGTLSEVVLEVLSAKVSLS